MALQIAQFDLDLKSPLATGIPLRVGASTSLRFEDILEVRFALSHDAGLLPVGFPRPWLGIFDRRGALVLRVNHVSGGVEWPLENPNAGRIGYRVKGDNVGFGVLNTKNPVTLQWRLIGGFDNTTGKEITVAKGDFVYTPSDEAVIDTQVPVGPSVGGDLGGTTGDAVVQGIQSVPVDDPTAGPPGARLVYDADQGRLVWYITPVYHSLEDAADAQAEQVRGEHIIVFNDPPLQDDGLYFVRDRTESIEDYDIVLGGGAGGVYNNSEPSVITVGGIPSGTTFENVSFSDFVTMLLYPEMFGTLTPPSATFTSTVTGLREIGETVNIGFTAGFNRGSISPPYESATPHRSGDPLEYLYTGDGLPATSPGPGLSNPQSVSGYVVQEGVQSWTSRVAYAAGPQPKSSKGNPFDEPLAPGQTSAITRSITGVYPYFATTSSIGTLSKRPLANHGATVVTDVVAESGGNKQAVEFPVAWGSIAVVEQWDTLNSVWVPISLGLFDTSSHVREIQGNDVDYIRYTHNGPTVGARQLRWRT